jgi:hypothetical protein
MIAADRGCADRDHDARVAELLVANNLEVERRRNAEDQLRDLQGTFDRLWAAQERAINRWRAANPGNEMVMPDHAALVEWLLSQAAPVPGEAACVFHTDKPRCVCGQPPAACVCL